MWNRASAHVAQSNPRADPGWSSFQRLWFGLGVSELGTQASFVALPLLAVLVLHATPLQLGILVAVQQGANMVLGLFIGVLVDRLNQRYIMLVADFGRFLLMASIPALATADMLSMHRLYGIAAAISILTSFFDIANQSYLPKILITRDGRAEATSLIGGTSAAAQIAGRTAAGMVVQYFSAAIVLVGDAVSFLISFLAIKALPKTPKTPRQQRTSMWREIREGLSFIRKHWLLPRLLVAAMLANSIVAGQAALLIVFLVEDVKVSPALIGLLLISEGIGGLIGGFFVARKFVRWFQPGRIIGIALCVEPVFAGLIPFTHLRSGLWGLAFFVVGIIGMEISVLTFTIVARICRMAIVPEDMMGRVYGASKTFITCTIPIGALAGGYLGQQFGPRIGLAILAGALVLAPMTVLRGPVWRLTHAHLGMAN